MKLLDLTLQPISHINLFLEYARMEQLDNDKNNMKLKIKVKYEVMNVTVETT